MAEIQLGLFDLIPINTETIRKNRRVQQEFQLDALLLKYVGSQEYDRQKRKDAELTAKFTAFMRGYQRSPEIQDRIDEMRAKVMVTAKPYLAHEYTLLGVQPGATKRDIKNAYRRQARKLHPDKGGDAQAFQQMHDAYRRLLASVKE